MGMKNYRLAIAIAATSLAILAGFELMRRADKWQSGPFSIDWGQLFVFVVMVAPSAVAGCIIVAKAMRREHGELLAKARQRYPVSYLYVAEHGLNTGVVSVDSVDGSYVFALAEKGELNEVARFAASDTRLEKTTVARSLIRKGDGIALGVVSGSSAKSGDIRFALLREDRAGAYMKGAELGAAIAALTSSSATKHSAKKAPLPTSVSIAGENKVLAMLRDTSNAKLSFGGYVAAFIGTLLLIGVLILYGFFQ